MSRHRPSSPPFFAKVVLTVLAEDAKVVDLFVTFIVGQWSK